MNIKRKLRKILQKHLWRFIGLFIVLFFLFSICMIYHFERKSDSNLTIFDAFRIVLVFFLGEYGDTPETRVGQVISVVLFIFGIVVVAAIIGKIAAIFIELKMEVKMPQLLEDHIVICNWNDKGDRIIKELHSPLAAPDTDIIIITEIQVDENELRKSPEYERVYFIKSDPTLHDVLKRAHAHFARSVILLTNDNCSDPDAQTALIALAITKLEENIVENPHIVAEISNPHKVQHLLDAGVDEWICSANYGLGILAQAALFGKLSNVYQQLLTFSNETNEIYLVDDDKYPSSFFGKNFNELSIILNTYRNTDNPAILIGIKRNNEVILNPKQNQFDSLRIGDSLIVMSFDPSDFKNL